jgi:hypothetical protein
VTSAGKPVLALSFDQKCVHGNGTVADDLLVAAHRPEIPGKESTAQTMSTASVRAHPAKNLSIESQG